jgi:hypothetical protein
MNNGNKERLDLITAEIKVLDEFARKPNDIYERIDSGDKQIHESVKRELSLLQKQVFNRLGEMDTVATETNYKCSRIDRMYDAMKEDILRHETLAFELALKFESQHELLL